MTNERLQNCDPRLVQYLIMIMLMTMMMMTMVMMMMMMIKSGVVVGYWPSDGCLILGLRDRGPPRGPVSVSNIHSIIHPRSSTAS